ncbi:MAG: hypothetical protein ACF8LK_05700 [Phycisphaerales bacterium JB041]
MKLFMAVSRALNVRGLQFSSARRSLRCAVSVSARIEPTVAHSSDSTMSRM